MRTESREASHSARDAGEPAHRAEVTDRRGDPRALRGSVHRIAEASGRVRAVCECVQAWQACVDVLSRGNV